MGKASKISMNAYTKCLIEKKVTQRLVSAYANIHPYIPSRGVKFIKAIP